MVEKFSAVTVKHADGSEESVAALTCIQLRQALLPEKRRKHRNERVLRHDVEYTAYLLSPRWAAERTATTGHIRRSAVRAGRRRTFTSTILTYERLGSERDSDLIALCRVCHSKVHRLHARSSVSLRAVTGRYVAEVRVGGRGGGDRQTGPAPVAPVFPSEAETGIRAGEHTPRRGRCGDPISPVRSRQCRFQRQQS